MNLLNRSRPASLSPFPALLPYKTLYDQYKQRRQYVCNGYVGTEGVTNPSEVERWQNEGFVSVISQIRGFVAYYVDAGAPARPAPVRP